MEFTVVIPAYNEENSIKEIVENIKKNLPKAEIIVVNDGSTDNTKKIVESLNVTLINHKQNMGYGAALKTGLKKAKTKYVGFIDADMTYDPIYLKLFLEYIKKKNLDCVWGNRFGGKINKMPLIRKIGNKFINFIFFLITFKKISDCTSGERVLSRNALKKIEVSTLPNDLDFITALTKRIVSRKLKYMEIPINYRERKGGSKLNLLKHGYKMIKNILIEK